MSTVYVCAPAIGDYVESRAMAQSIFNLALSQGHFPVVGRLPFPGDEENQKLQDVQFQQCEEIWLYYDGHKFRRDMLVDLDRAAAAGKAIRLVNAEISPETRRLVAASVPPLAADSYAEAPDRDEESWSEADEGQPEGPSAEFTMEAFSIDGLLLALRELDDIVGGALPYDWWEAVNRAKGDYLARLGVGGLMEALDYLVEERVLPPWPWYWKAELDIHFGERDWLGELPGLDRDNLEKIGDCEWHKLGHQLFLAGEYRRALGFLAEAVTDNPRNYLAWSDIGQCFMNISDIDMAIEAFQLSLTLAPANFYAWAGLGHSFLVVRRFSEAITAFDQALACKEDHSDPYVADLRAEALRGLNHAANNAAI